MTQSPRGKGRSRGTEEEFVLYLQGIPPHCRWQELKDFIRQSAQHIRQAVVYDDQQGYPTGLGQIIVKNEDEAWRTYQRLSTNGWDGQTLTVTLARASSPTRPIAGPTRSPTCFPPPSYVRGGYSRSAAGITAPASPISSESMATPPASYQSPEPITIVNYTGVNNVIPFPMDPMFQPVQPVHPVPWNPATAKGAAPFPTAGPAPMFTPPFDPVAFSFYPYQYQMPAVHPIPPAIQNNCQTNMFQQYYHSYGYEMHNTHMNMDVNNMAATNVSFPTYPVASSSSSSSSSRSVVIHNLAPDVNQQVLAEHFRGAGTIERCDIIIVSEEDSKSSPSSSGDQKGSASSSHATATFRTDEEAKRAVELCDKSLLLGRRIRVRLALVDWEAESIPADIPTPTLTASSSASFSSSSSSKKGTPESDNKNSRRRDSGKEFSFQDSNNNNNRNDKPDTTTTTTAPRYQPLVVNGSCVRRRNDPTATSGPGFGLGHGYGHGHGRGPNASSFGLVEVNN